VAKGPFTVIDGTPPPPSPKASRAARIKASTPPELVRCFRCSSGAMMQIRLGMIWRNGKPTAGNKQIVCASCLSKGEIVTISF